MSNEQEQEVKNSHTVSRPQAIIRSKVETLRGLLYNPNMQQQLMQALPKHVTVDRLLRVAMTSVQKVPDLLDCDPISVTAAILECAQLGLLPDGILGEAYLVPYNDKRRGMICQFQAGYRGLISLARRSGQVSNIYSELIFKCDKYSVTLGLKKNLEHEPDWENPDRGRLEDGEFVVPLVGAYAVVVFKDETNDFEYMPIGLLNQVRATSKAKSERSPWFTSPGEMYRKTPIRRIAKRLPLSAEFQRAAILDEYADAGVSQGLAGLLGDEGDEPVSEKKDPMKVPMRKSETAAAAQAQEQSAQPQPEEPAKEAPKEQAAQPEVKAEATVIDQPTGESLFGEQPKGNGKSRKISDYDVKMTLSLAGLMKVSSGELTAHIQKSYGVSEVAELNGAQNAAVSTWLSSKGK